MSKPRSLLPLLLSLAPLAAAAEPPRVATDIAPVAGLVDRVMAGLGQAETVLPPGTSPHDAALRPSQARALAAADLVVWVGPALTPWLADRIEKLSAAPRLMLLEAPGTTLLPAREDHDHDHDHDHGPTDPHAWLDPRNGAAWLAAIAEALAELDPENAAAYRANAEAGQAELAALESRLAESLEPLHDRAFMTAHDATQYLEARFGLASAGALADSDATAPSPARLAELRARLDTAGVVCLLAEPQQPAALFATLAEGHDLATGAVDILGADLAPGPGFYAALLETLAGEIATCLAPPG